MQEGGRGSARPPIGIAFEGDLGQRIDAVLAIALLSGFAAKAEARSIAIAISRPSLKAAQLAEVISSFYFARPPLIGVPEGAPPADDAPVLAKALAEKTAEGGPRYTPGIKRLLDTPDNAVLIRNNLLGQHDGNARIVVAGPLSGLARLLGLYGARPQIAAKAERLVVTAGSFPTGQPDAGDHQRHRRGEESLRRMADAHRRRRRGGRRGAAVSGCHDREGFRRGRRRIRWLTRTARSRPMPYDAPALGARRDAACGEAERAPTSSCPRPARSACSRMAACDSRLRSRASTIPHRRCGTERPRARGLRDDGGRQTRAARRARPGWGRSGVGHMRVRDVVRRHLGDCAAGGDSDQVVRAGRRRPTAAGKAR